MCDLIMWDKACIADRNIWYSCDDVLSYSVFFRPPVALLCSYGFTLDTTIQTGSQLKILCGWRDRTELRPKAWSITSRHQVSSCAWHMFTKKNSCLLHFNLSHPPFHSSSSKPPVPFLLWLRHHSVRNRWSPRGPVLNPSLTLHAAFSSSSLKPPLKLCCEWQPERHLSQEPAAQTEEDTSKKCPKTERQWKRSAAEEDF